MLQTEAIRVLLFVAAVGGVYVLAIGVLLRMLVARVRGRAEPSRRQAWAERSVLFVAALGAGCMVYGWQVEPWWPQTTNVRLTSGKIPADTRPIRIVHLSDIHSDPQARLEEKLPALVSALSPDLIVFTGDAINSREGLPVFRKCMTSLAALAPTFVVRGNWDVWYWPDVDLYEGTGARELKGDGEAVPVAGTTLFVSGARVGDPAFEQALDGAPPGTFSLFLYHYPDEIQAIAAREADLYLAGHTHGGHVALPLYGALLTFSRFGKRYESGLHEVDHTRLYVNRGIGMEGGHAPRVRFFARPEITLVQIAPLK